MRPAPVTPRASLSEQESRDIAQRATTLFEHLDRTDLPLLTAAAPPTDVFVAWAKAFAAGDAEALSRRLAWDGLDRSRVQRALSVAPAASATTWTSWLDLFLEEAAALAPALGSPATLAEIESLTSTGEPPFVEVWLALTRAARRALAASGVNATEIRPGAARDLERALMTELSRAGELALFEVLRGGRSGESTGRYAAFVQGVLEGGLARVFQEYPVLARQLATLAASWVETSQEFYARLHDDRAALELAFGVAPADPVAAIAPALSDRHDGGRRVAVLRFESGRRLVYKPRDVGLERALQEFLTALAARGLPDAPGAAATLERPGYGWAEFVAEEGFEDEAQVSAYFRKAGGLVAVLHVLRGTDAHHENVVATRRGPVLVDAEMLLQPVDRNEEQDAGGTGRIDSAARGLPRSCVSSGLVTLVDVDGDGQAYDAGGLVAALPRGATLRGRAWRDLRQDSLRFEPGSVVLPEAHNLVVRAGRVESPQAHALELVAGFETAYRFFAAERAWLLSPEGPLTVFEGRRCRLMFRPSDQYGASLLALAAPRYQRSGLAFGIALETLNRVFSRESERPRLWPLVADERRSLEAWDVPRYLVGVDENVLRTSGGALIEGHLVRSGLEAAKDTLRGLGEEDLERQRAALRDALEVPGPALTLSEFEMRKARTDAGLVWRRAAALLGDVLLAREASWRDEFEAASSDGDTLYRGVAGLALSFAALSAVSGTTRYAEAARRLVRALDARRDPADDSALGACTGLGSLAYALGVTGRLLGDDTATALALRAARAITPERIAADTRLDVVSGSAGALFALLSLADAGDGAWLDERLEACASRLLATQVATGDGTAAWPASGEAPLSGFAHGAAGIGAALARLHARTGDARLPEAVRRARRHEAAHPDAVTITAWCYGAPGQALGRGIAADRLLEESDREQIQAALQAAAGATHGRLDHLCCGNLGRAEALLTLGRQHRSAEAVTAAEAVATRVAERVLASGRFGARTEGFENRAFRPGFFRGLAGVVYQLLRTAAPSRLPSVLAFEPGSATRS